MANVDNEIIENKILSFSSTAAMQLKIDEINSLEKKKELEVQQKLLDRNKLSNPILSDLELYKKNKFSNLNKSEIINDLKFYHNERLRVIYELRNELKFTSIQSIADEINSLKLLNPDKSNALFDKFSLLLERTEFCISTIFGKNESSVISTTGEIEINGKKILMNDKAQSGIQSTYEGILVNNGIYAITYAAGVNKNILGDNTQRFTQFASFVNFGAGFVLYPSWFYRGIDANAVFKTDVITEPVPFLNYYGEISTNLASSDFLTIWSPLFSTPPYIQASRASGTFITILNGQFVTLSGSQIIW